MLGLFSSFDFSSILIFIGSIAFLIFIHELGHFLAARMLGVEIDEFGLGFPPRILTLFRYKGTDYTLNWIPLGGFVRPKGENDPDIPGGLAASSPWVRLGVLIAGPAMNLLAGVIIFSFLFARIGEPDPSIVKVLEVTKNSPAEQAGIMAGDIINEVAGIQIDSTGKLQEVIYDNLGNEVTIRFHRDALEFSAVLTPRENPPPNEGAIGIVMTNPTNQISTVDAIRSGISAISEQTKAIISLPGKYFSGSLDPNQGRLLGYKGMYDIFSTFREYDQNAYPGTPGGINTLGFLGSITISLALLNLFPIPALDGGRILFLLPEILFKKRVPILFENVVNAVGFFLLIFLMIYVNILDFTNPAIIP